MSAKSTAAFSNSCSKQSTHRCGQGTTEFPFHPALTQGSQEKIQAVNNIDCDFSYHGKNGSSPMTMCHGDNNTVVMGGTEGLIGVYKLDTNNLVLMQSQQYFNNNPVMCIRKLIGATNLYAFSALTYGVSILDINSQ